MAQDSGPNGPIQVLPPGLLGFLQLKTAGQNPHSLGSEISPSFDVRDWYFEARMLDWVQDQGLVPGIAVAPGAANGFFSPNVVEVPKSELWWVDQYSIQTAVLGAGDTCQFACMMRTPTVGTVNNYVIGDPSPLMTGSAVGRINVARAEHFFAPSGARFGFVAMVNETGGTITYNGSLRFVRLPI